MKIIYNRGHWEIVTDSGEFVLSADTWQEAETELVLFREENGRKSA